MKRIYQQPRLFYIIAGIPTVLVGTFPLWFPFIVDGAHLSIKEIIFNQILCLSCGIYAMLFQLLFTLLFLGIAFLGLRFMLQNKNQIRLQFEEDRLVYYRYETDHIKGRAVLISALLYLEKVKSKHEIYYKDIIDVVITRDFWKKDFLIVTRDQKQQHLPMVFPKKDTKAILAFIQKRQ